MGRFAVNSCYICPFVTRMGATTGHRFRTSELAFSDYLLVKVWRVSSGLYRLKFQTHLSTPLSLGQCLLHMSRANTCACQRVSWTKTTPGCNLNLSRGLDLLQARI